jgi:hypothetical protein
MGEQSQREEMGAAIRAQRERHAVPRSISPQRPADEKPPAPPRRGRLLGRLRGK